MAPSSLSLKSCRSEDDEQYQDYENQGSYSDIHALTPFEFPVPPYPAADVPKPGLARCPSGYPVQS
jgi:hypothetical protein